jgi:hypothetical protein
MTDVNVEKDTAVRRPPFWPIRQSTGSLIRTRGLMSKDKEVLGENS